MIKYLIKFVSQLSHAEALINGKLFMRPASYYHELEVGQGDIREAAIASEARIYKQANLPIYCMYAVFEKDITEGYIHIPNKILSDFKCKDGYAVVINPNDFYQRLNRIDCDRYSMRYGPVEYKLISISDFLPLANASDFQSLFIKHPHFSYQQEFRVVIGKAVYRYDEIPKADHVVYTLPDSISNISKVVELKSSSSSNGTLMIPTKGGNTNA